jgi:hypothetical protein
MPALAKPQGIDYMITQQGITTQQREDNLLSRFHKVRYKQYGKHGLTSKTTGG